MAKKVKKAAANLPIPADDSEARETIRAIGDANRDIIRLQAEMNDQIAAVQEEYGEKVAPLRARVEALTDGLQMYADVNRVRLTRDGKVKFAEFVTGKISWRHRPAKVSLRKVDEVIAAIKAAGLAKKFLRVKEEINKDAMLEKANVAQASGIAGVTIGSDGEDFIVEPYEIDLKGAA
ncbi:host-nuclease inhibitor Gam family protein [Paracoccus sp. (in: a-proteobacteria)]|uniref:host-nuclease inhibitor Gam family protein n=1 Tax=Paracoccus sp. TaxID=267 RepID=UPI0026E092FA|nr:host-nuclease inhibitor Gam family protein [Paracoccus sp. (in: a-proteobacteria)]MDO5648722.1 host-nuclease inhibitor Gam family protein [Paracoccus sp. (in: a-proteobacteria)]